MEPPIHFGFELQGLQLVINSNISHLTKLIFTSQTMSEEGMYHQPCLEDDG